MVFKKRLIPHSIPQLPPNTLSIIAKKILTGKVNHGKEINRLEKEFARYIGTKHAVCFASGRYALQLIYSFFNCKDKTVLLPSYTCVAAIDGARWAGAHPLFLDIDLNTYNPILNPNPKETNKEIHKNAKNLSAICFSYLYGLVGNLEPLIKFAKENQLPIVEDAAICIGGEYRHQKVGALGDAAIFSLQSSKIITAWRGGIITTNNPELYQYLINERNKLPQPPFLKLLFNLSFTYLRTLLSHPRLYGLTLHPLKKILCSKFLSPLLGKIIEQNPLEAVDGQSSEITPSTEKYQFTNLQAALTLSSLKNINFLLKRRRGPIKNLISRFKDEKKVHFPQEKDGNQHTFGRFPLRLPGIDKHYLEKRLLQAGIETSLYYPYICPNTQHMKKYNFNPKEFPNAITAAQETILLPAHAFLKKKDIDIIEKAIRSIINERFPVKDSQR